MKHKPVIRRYQGWIEGSLGTEERRDIERHIGECNDCRWYYEKMSRLLEKTDPALLPHLVPDPFLPTRIRAMTENRRARPVDRRAAWVRRSLAGAAFVLAVTAGVFLGRGLSANARLAGETDLAGAYYEAFSPADIAGGWVDVMNQTSSNGQKKGDR